MGRALLHLSALACAVLTLASSARAADPLATADPRLEALRRQVAEQSARPEALRRSLTQEKATLNEVKRALGIEVLASQRVRGVAPESTVAQASQDPGAARPVGQVPESEGRAPSVAPILEQPGVLTPKGKAVLEPSLQYSYSSSNRIALVGCTVIPAILIGMIDVCEVKRNTFNATLTGRYDIANHFELEARVPYVYRSDTSIGREILQGAATDNGVGDAAVTGRYQFNDGGLDTPYFVGSLRFKSRTGKDPFEVMTSRYVPGVRDGVQTSLPTGSFFYGLLPTIEASRVGTCASREVRRNSAWPGAGPSVEASLRGLIGVVW